MGYSQEKWTQGPAATISPAGVAALNWPSPFHSPGEGYPRIEYDSQQFERWSDLRLAAPPSLARQPQKFPRAGITANRLYGPSSGTPSALASVAVADIYTQTESGSLGRINYNGEYSGDDFADSLLGASPSIAITETGPYVQCKPGNDSPPGFPQLRALRAGRLEGQRQADLESRLAL